MASTHFPGEGKYSEGGEKLTSNPVGEYEARGENAAKWQGWGTALKPSHEPVVVATKPLLFRDILLEIGSQLDILETWLARAADPTTPTGEAGASPAPTAMSPFASEATTFLSTVTSWRSCWAELWTAASKSTTSTASSTTTDLRILSSCLSQIMRGTITPDPMRADGWKSLVEGADGLFAAAVLSLRATLALSAPENVTKSTHTNSQGEAAKSSPAHEPIVVARKPLQGTVAANVLKHGTGALNIDACRIGTTKDIPASPRRAEQGPAYSDLGNDPGTGSGWNANVGRWPANLVLSHTEDCKQIGESQIKGYAINRFDDGAKPFGNGAGHPYSSEQTPDETIERWDCAEGCPVRALDEQAGEVGSGWKKNYAKQYAEEGRQYSGGSFGGGGYQAATFADKGGPSRFFANFHYVAKANRRERNAGLEDFEATFAPTMGNGIGGKEHKPPDAEGVMPGDAVAAKRNMHPT